MERVSALGTSIKWLLEDICTVAKKKERPNQSLLHRADEFYKDLVFMESFLKEVTESLEKKEGKFCALPSQNAPHASSVSDIGPITVSI
jgi:hypothetical protein